MALLWNACRRVVLAGTAFAELLLGFLFYAWPNVAFGLLGRPVLDPVISRQYGLFLCSVALMYAILATDPIGFRRVIWVGVAQRVAEIAIAVIDWRAGDIPLSSFVPLLLAEIAAAVVLAACATIAQPKGAPRPLPSATGIWLRRSFIGFGVLQLFWAVLSTVFVQFGSRLLGWKVQDAYTTQQQGIALMVIGLTSLIVANDYGRYRSFIWVPICSQALGVANAVNELRLGTITLTIALVQWAIEAAIIALFLSLSSSPQTEASNVAPAAIR